MPATYDRSIVLGVIALRLEFISELDFLAGVKHRLSNHSASLGDVLVAQGTLTSRQLEMLNPLVDEHLSRHGNEPLRSLQALRGTSLIDEALSTPVETSRADSTTTFVPASADTDEMGQPAPLTETKPFSASAQPVPLRGDAHRGRYRIIEFYKRGGLGEIYRAYDEQLGRTVALKQINQKYVHADVMRRRFNREAEINGRLEHPAIVPVYSLGRHEDGRPFYTMRFVAGEELGAAIKRYHAPSAERDGRPKSVELRQLLRRFIDICNAIAYAHSRGVVHRDLKPANVLVGSFGETFLIDWGVAKAGAGPDSPPLLDDDLPAEMHTEAGATVGTLRYMSPEQACGDISAVTTAADVFGLGAVLYEILTGRPPIAGSTSDEVLQNAVEANIALPRSVRDNIPRPLESICLKALSRIPVDRYESASKLAADVENWLADEPVEAHADLPLERLGRAARRNRTAVASAAVLLLATTIALCVISGLTTRQNRALFAASNQIAANFEKATSENRRAEENLDDWRQAAFELRVIAEGAMARMPGAENQRLRMTELLVQTLNKMIVQRSDDRDVRRDLALACRIHANLQRLMSNQEGALDSYRQALSHLEELVSTDSADEKSQLQLAETLRDQSNSLQATGDLDKAVAALARASEIVAALRSRSPHSSDYERTNAMVLTDMADPLIELGKDEEALDCCATAANVFRRLADSQARQSTDVPMLLLTRNKQAETLRQLGRAQESAEALAVVLAEARTEAAGGDPDLRHALARSLFNQSQLLFAADAGQSEAATKEALEIWTDLTRKFPQRAFYQRYRAQAIILQGRLRAQAGQPAEARTLIKLAHDQLAPIVAAQPTSIPFREALADACLELARVLRAEGSQSDAKVQFELARDHLRQIAEKKPKSVPTAARLKAVESEILQLPADDN